MVIFNNSRNEFLISSKEDWKNISKYITHRIKIKSWLSSTSEKGLKHPELSGLFDFIIFFWILFKGKFINFSKKKKKFLKNSSEKY